MIEKKIKTYEVKNPVILEKINETLNKTFEHGFTKGNNGSDCLCFFDNKDIFVMIYKDGRVELSPSINPSIINYIEKQLNYNGSKN